MKIEIEWNCSYKATIRIAGRELEVQLKPGVTSIHGLKDGEPENTLGGMIATELYGKIADAMQAECIATDAITPDDAQDVTWMRMDDHTADQVYSRIH